MARKGERSEFQHLLRRDGVGGQLAPRQYLRSSFVLVCFSFISTYVFAPKGCQPLSCIVCTLIKHVDGVFGPWCNLYLPGARTTAARASGWARRKIAFTRRFFVQSRAKAGTCRSCGQRASVTAVTVKFASFLQAVFAWRLQRAVVGIYEVCVFIIIRR